VSKLITIIEEGPCLYKGKGASNEQIADAEERLGLKFAPEFHDYLTRFGYVAINGCELTGLGAEGFDGVVEITLDARNRIGEHLENLYVVEQTNIDGILIWQDFTGTIYQSAPGVKPTPIAKSLGDYLENSSRGL